jgi:trigger factor
MQHIITRGEKGKVEIKVDVSKADFDKAYEHALAELGQEVKVDGFRPGNVPVNLVEDKLGITKILNEAANFLVSQHLSDIFDKENIVPIVKPKVAVNSLSKGAPFSFVATLTERSKVKLGDWKAIKVKKIKVKEVTEVDVNESIKNIYDAWLKDPKSQAPKAVSEDADEEEGKKFIYDAQGNKIFLKDDEKDTKKSEGKIDDEFAKAIGARDLLHLQELVRKDLETIVTDQVEAKFEEEIFEELTKIGEVDVPDVMVDDEINRIMVRLNQQVESSGKKLEDFLRDENTTVDALRAKWRVQAEKNVKATLILDEIGTNAKIEVSREEVENAGKGVNQTDLTPEQKVDMERYLAVSIFQAKTLDLVKKTVTIL